MIKKTHHALVDGVSGVDVATVILDREGSPADVPVSDWTPREAPSGTDLLAAALAARTGDALSRLGAIRQAPSTPDRAAPAAARVGRTVRMEPGWRPAPR